MRRHHLHGRGSIATLVIMLLIVAHAFLVGVAARRHVAWLLALGVVGMALLKYGWWKLRG